MRIAVIVFLWLVLSMSYFSSNDGKSDETAAHSSLYIGNVDATINSKDTVFPLRLHVIQRQSVLSGLSVASMSLQLTENNTKIGWYMEGVGTSSSSMWHGRTNPRLFPHASTECGVNLEATKGKADFQGTFVSDNCNLSGRFSANLVDWTHITRKAMHWSIMLNICTILEIRAFVSQASVGHLNQVSLYSIGVIAMSGLIEAALIVGLGLSYSLEFNTFSVVALFKFIIFALLHMSYLGSVWKARLPHDEDGNVDSGKMTQFYVRFYMAAMMMLVVVARFWNYLPVFVVCSQCGFAPQIAFDVYHGHRHSVTLSFVVLISVCKLAPALYLYGCPHSIFSGDAMPQVPNNDGHGNLFVATLLCVCSIGVMCLAISQKRYGPRWFTPMICLPHVYNYVRQVELREGMPHECVICMAEIDSALAISQLSVTPCDHVFHKSCLEQWLEIKMECPTCRMDLPPL